MWYSQLDGYIGGIHYWNTEKLDQLRFPSGINVGGWNNNQFVFINHNQTSNSNGTPKDVMRKGCGIVSAAMLIRNRGLYLKNITDYRYGTSGLSYADPFTVFLASNGLTGSEINVSANTLSRSGLTAAVNFPTISNRLYTKSLGWYGTNTVKGWSNSTKVSKLKEAIQNHIGGVVIGFSDHFIIATGYNASGATDNDKFIVCETFSVNPSAADNVPYSKTSSYNNYGNITNYQSLYYIQE